MIATNKGRVGHFSRLAMRLMIGGLNIAHCEGKKEILNQYCCSPIIILWACRIWWG